MKHIYICGPVTGRKAAETAKHFAGAEEKIRRAFNGVVGIVNPTRLCTPDMDWHKAMRLCVSELAKCGGIALLQGWQRSKGAALELKLAQDLHLPVVFVEQPVDYIGLNELFTAAPESLRFYNTYLTKFHKEGMEETLAENRTVLELTNRYLNQGRGIIMSAKTKNLRQVAAQRVELAEKGKKTAATVKIERTFMTDAQGRQVPENLVKDIDKKRDATVHLIAAKALKQKQILAEFREEIREQIYSFVELSAKEYGVSFGGKKGNISLLSYDGKYKLQVQMNDNITFDERLQVARELIGKCIEKWSDGARSEIRVLVNDAFQVDKQGKISTARVLGLRRLDIQDKDWQKAMTAITESVQVTGTKQYLRIYERDANGEYQMIPLDVSAL